MGSDQLQTRMEGICGYAPGYHQLMFEKNLQRIGLEEQDLRDSNPHPATAVFLRYHAFARAGGEQAGYGEIAHSAFENLDLDDSDPVPPNELWDAFKAGCEQKGVGVNARLNQGVITGIATLANRRGNPFRWVREEVESTGELRPAYLELHDITGIGRKIATFILRDIVWFWGIETQVAVSNREYLHPIDRWVSRVALSLWPDLDGASRTEIAQRIADECTKHDVSNTEFNQGAWYLGARELDGDQDQLEVTLDQGFE